MRSSKGRLCALLLSAGLWAGPAAAVMPDPEQQRDIKRFGLDAPQTAAPGALRSARAREAVSRFNAANSGRYGAAMRASARMAASAAGRVPSGAVFAPAAADVADAFLRKSSALLGLDPSQLRLALARSDGGIHHLLFEQVHGGIPVEFARVKVHVDSDGNVVSAQSVYREAANLSPLPLVGEQAAAATAAADLGRAGPVSPGRLTYYPKRSGELRLAWKFRLGGPGGRWVYYVDAWDGALLFRYNELRYCEAEGYMRGEVVEYDYDPVSHAGPEKSVQPFAHQEVYVGDVSHHAATDANGHYCSPDPGKIFTQLRGPYVNVANYNTVNAHYDNGAGVWSVFSSTAFSPHPYPNNAVHFSTINAPSLACAGNTDPVKVVPNFSRFEVGKITPDADIMDADYLDILDSADNSVGVYLGTRNPFRGPAVVGKQVRFRLRTDAAGQNYGYAVSVSSYLCLTDNQYGTVNLTGTLVWVATRTYDGTDDEINIFYHANKAHDYFTAGPNSSNSISLDKPLLVMAHMGTGAGGINNSFYDPVGKFIGIGDVSQFAQDGSIIYHEYVHYVVDQIFPILGFGQDGAISEGLSDYFPASALNNSRIGGYVFGGGAEGALRNIDSTAVNNFKGFPQNWTGEQHSDGLILSEPLWEIRKSLMGGPLGAVNGRRCADQLVFRSLFFFPDNFRDFLEAMLQVSQRASALAPACIGDMQHDGLIAGQFHTHGIVEDTRDGEDPYEPNDGVQSATDISTASVIRARIYQAADIDYYSIPAGPGPLRLTLTLPANALQPGTYFAYSLTLVDRNINMIQEAAPKIDVNPVPGSGLCPNPPDDCLTSQSRVVLEYSVPASGQYYAFIAGALADYVDYASNSNTNSPEYYTLQADYTRPGAIAAWSTTTVSGSTVTASFDSDIFSFQVGLAVFGSTAVYGFHHARLREHALSVLPQTDTTEPGSYLIFMSSSLRIQASNEAVKSGTIEGQIRLANGFAERFPRIGTVHLEVFGVNQLAQAAPESYWPTSLGLSPAINLIAKENKLTAWNNVFNPVRGEKATFRYDTTEPGHVRLRLYTMSGTLVNTLVDADLSAGERSVDWYGANSAGNRVASGIYLLHMDAPGGRKVQKVIVVK
ncbi:MAG: hypothetical protein HY922_14010 [Elusimicrobia bacterium]|nr:hypothetical protein [Elusimicrobiota bacterium]